MAASSSHELSRVFSQAEGINGQLDGQARSSEAQYQTQAQAAIALYNQAANLVVSAGLFSTNESREDLSTPHIPYLYIDYRLAHLMEHLRGADHHVRTHNLNRAEALYSSFLERLQSYDLLSSDDARLFRLYQSRSSDFSLNSRFNSAEERRNEKIARLKYEQNLKQSIIVRLP